MAKHTGYSHSGMFLILKSIKTATCQQLFAQVDKLIWPNKNEQKTKHNI